MANKSEIGSGTFEGEVYYSSTMPKGKKDDWPFKYYRELEKTMGSARTADNDSLKAIQKTLISMKLLEPGQDDGYYGNRTKGAVKRYLLNTQPSMFDAIKESDFNIFK